jgi:hypothetical protein
MWSLRKVESAIPNDTEAIVCEESLFYPHFPSKAPAAAGVRLTPCSTILVSTCSNNDLGNDGATALSSGLTALTSLQSIDIRWGSERMPRSSGHHHEV